MIYEWKCEHCGEHAEVERKMSDHALPPEMVDCEAKSECKWKRVYSAPMQMKASYLDGQRKFTDAKEAANLKKEARQSKDPGKRAEIRKEVHRMGQKQYD